MTRNTTITNPQICRTDVLIAVKEDPDEECIDRVLDQLLDNPDVFTIYVNADSDEELINEVIVDRLLEGEDDRRFDGVKLDGVHVVVEYGGSDEVPPTDVFTRILDELNRDEEVLLAVAHDPWEGLGDAWGDIIITTPGDLDFGERE